MTSSPTASFGFSLARARPRTTRQTPHVQRDQHSPPDIHAELMRRRATLDGTTMGRSGFSAATSLALHLDATWPGVLMTPSRILHITLPLVVAREAIERQLAEMHPATRMGYAPNTLVLVSGPRNDAESTLTRERVGQSPDYIRGLQGRHPFGPSYATAASVVGAS